MNKPWIFVIIGFFAAGAIIAAAAIMSHFELNMRHEQSISVKGFAKTDVRSDIGAVTCLVAARHADRAEAMRLLEQHRQSVLSFLRTTGVPDDEITPGVPQIQSVLEHDKNGRETNVVEFYDATVSFDITSAKVERIAEVSRGIASLAGQGVFVSVYPPRYLLRDPDAMKLELLSVATANAGQRARILAEKGGGRIGALRSAQQGVFQITQPNSTDVSSYGEYDTSTIAKEAKIVVTLEYEVRQ